MLNMSTTPRPVALPAPRRAAWRRALDTALASPQDIAPPERAGRRGEDRYVVQPRSVVVLEAH